MPGQVGMRVVCFLLSALTVAAYEYEPLNCVSCPPGSFLNQTSVQCQLCPQPKMTSPGNAESSVLDCICEAGFTPSLNTSVSVECEPCQLHHYKPTSGNETCLACDPNEVTLNTGNTQKDACVCTVGFFRDGETCTPCIAGSFKNSPGNQGCVPCTGDHYCPEGSVTPVPCSLNSLAPTCDTSPAFRTAKLCDEKFIIDCEYKTSKLKSHPNDLTLTPYLENFHLFNAANGLDFSGLYGRWFKAADDYRFAKVDDYTIDSSSPQALTFYFRMFQVYKTSTYQQHLAFAKDGQVLFALRDKHSNTNTNYFKNNMQLMFKNSGGQCGSDLYVDGKKRFREWVSFYFFYNGTGSTLRVRNESGSIISETYFDDDWPCVYKYTESGSPEVKTHSQVHWHIGRGFTSNGERHSNVIVSHLWISNSHFEEPSIEEANCQNCRVCGGSSDIFDCSCDVGFSADFQAPVPPASDHTLLCSQCPTGTYNDALNRTACADCPINTFMPLLGSDAESDCQTCPSNTESLAGSDEQSDCVCSVGYYHPVIGVANCAPCAAGTFNSNINQTICVNCSAGYYSGVSASNSTSNCQQCPTNTDSNPGSDALIDCKCDPGFFSTLNDAGTANICEECAPGSFNPYSDQTECTLCPAGKFSNVEGAVDDPCTDCDPGHVATTAGAISCTACVAGKYQDRTLDNQFAQDCTDCPAHSTHSIEGSSSVLDCNCAAGFRRDATADPETLVCAVCAAGHYCPDGIVQTLCPANSYSSAGVTSCTPCGPHSRGVGTVRTDSSFCQCIEGAEGDPGSCSLCIAGEIQPLNLSAHPAVRTDCTPCAIGTYQPGTGLTVCLTCTGNSSSVQGSVAATDCKCVPGFFGLDGGPCEPCPRGSFCPGQQPAPSACRLHSSSPPQSDAPEDCFCLPGYVGARTASTCNKCPRGFYCPGDTAQHQCSSNSSSLLGSDAIEDCTCQNGYWRNCIETLNGSFVDTNNQACTINWAVPCVPCGADVICFNNSLLECPDDSTAPRGSHTARDCVCDDGFYAVYG